MRNRPRNSDGTLRKANQPGLTTNRSSTAPWVESETLHLKRLGMSFQRIAEHLVAVADGHQQAMVPIPEHLRFPQDYSISPQAVHHAFRRALVRLPNIQAAELRKLDSERCEDFLLSLQPGIRKGDPRSVEVGVKVLAYKRKQMAIKPRQRSR
jgi:hypothetical protein